MIRRWEFHLTWTDWAVGVWWCRTAGKRLTYGVQLGPVSGHFVYGWS